MHAASQARRSAGETPTDRKVQRLLEALPSFGTITAAGHAWLGRAAGLDEQAFSTEFGAALDVSNVGVERNVFRYRPIPVLVRFSDGADPAEFLRE